MDVQRTSDGTIGYFRRIGATINPALGIYANETGNSVGFNTDYAGAVSPAITFSIATSEKVRIDNTGNLLIGKTDTLFTSAGTIIYPSSGLDVIRDGNPVLALNRLTSEGRIIDLYIATSLVGSICGLGGGGVSFNTSTTEKMRIASDGNVGINTTSPSDKLDVNGAVYIRGGNSLKLDNTSNNYVAQINNGGSSGASTLVFQTGGSPRMRIINNGNVGIGTATPSTELEVVGTVTCTTLVETSSVSLKTNIKKLTSQTAKIAKLSPVSFNYKNNNKSSIGLIAEEVAKIYPELVEYENDRALGVNYSKLTSVLISAVNELAAEVAELKKQLNK